MPTSLAGICLLCGPGGAAHTELCLFLLDYLTNLVVFPFFSTLPFPALPSALPIGLGIASSTPPLIVKLRACCPPLATTDHGQRVKEQADLAASSA